MAQVTSRRTVTPGSMTLRSVTDGNTQVFLDDGMSDRSGLSSIGRRRIEKALAKKSRIDGKTVWRVVCHQPAKGCTEIDTENREWSPNDDARLEVHLKHRNSISAGSASNSVAAAAADKAKADRAQEVQEQVQIAVQTALAIKAAETEAAKPAARPSRAKAAPSA